MFCGTAHAVPQNGSPGGYPLSPRITAHFVCRPKRSELTSFAENLVPRGHRGLRIHCDEQAEAQRPRRPAQTAGRAVENHRALRAAFAR